MNFKWIKESEGEYNEHYCEFTDDSCLVCGNNRREQCERCNGTGRTPDNSLTSRFTIYSDKDEERWTLTSPADDVIQLEAHDLRSAMLEAVAEIKEWS